MENGILIMKDRGRGTFAEKLSWPERPSSFPTPRSPFSILHSPFRTAFSLVELLVVVGIIALLISILVPSLSGVRTSAKSVATKSQITGLSTALDAYKQESGLGGSYPPSKSDDNPSVTPPSDKIKDPFSTSLTDLNHTTGASLLVYALNGADGLGTPGFPDLSNDGQPGSNNKWSDDTSRKDTSPYGAYAIGASGSPQEGNPLLPRYGPYANSDPLIKSIKSIKELLDNQVYQAPIPAWNDPDYKHKVFTDSFKFPILYYRARSGARALVPPTGGTIPGIYDPSDNLAITGKTLQNGGVDPSSPGLYRPGGGQTNGHWLGYVVGNDTSRPPFPNLDDTPYANSFERLVWDKTVTARPTPVNKDTFLLISAGPDGRYGTADDIANFERR